MQWFLCRKVLRIKVNWLRYCLFTCRINLHFAPVLLSGVRLLSIKSVSYIFGMIDALYKAFMSYMTLEFLGGSQQKPVGAQRDSYYPNRGGNNYPRVSLFAVAKWD